MFFYFLVTFFKEIFRKKFFTGHTSHIIDLELLVYKTQ